LVALSTSQIEALTTAQIRNGLTLDQIASLTTDQVAALTTAQVQKGLNVDQVAALTVDQVAAFGSNQIQVLTTTQLVAMTTAQISAIETRDVEALSANQIAALTIDQVQNGLNTGQVVALTTSQIQALTTAQVVALSTDQVAVLETADVAALTTGLIAVLTTDQIHDGFTSAQVAAITSTQVCALSTEQIQAFGDNASTLTTGTPIILDLNGDGVTTLSYSAGTEFDLWASGQTVQTGWVSEGDGLLVLDRNHDGVINDGSELFGSSTVLADGQRAADGYVALSSMDTNGDGAISGADQGFADLQVWIDANSDGVTEVGELRTLDSLGITRLDLAATATNDTNNGNLIGLTSSYQTSDGALHQMADVWFVAEADATTVPLQTQVGGLVQAMATYASGATESSGTTLSSPIAAPSTALSGIGVQVSAAADVLKQLDANGQPLAVPTQQTAVASLAPDPTATLNAASLAIVTPGSKTS
ncbi:hypothetical protein SAMN05660652_03655, partial [Propionivibrio dicarboxylicus]